MGGDYTVLLRWLSFVHRGRFPPHGKSLYSTEDLFQEAKIVELSCRRKFRPELGVKFSTYLCVSVENYFLTLIRKEFRAVEAIAGLDKYEDRRGALLLPADAPYDYGGNPERAAIFAEGFEVLAKSHWEFAGMIFKGFPMELFYLVKRDMRLRRLKHGLNAIDGNVRLSQKLLKEFFGEKEFTKIRLAYYNMYVGKQ